MKYLILLLVVISVLCTGAYAMRKEMPFDFRIINIAGDLLIHNKTIWNARNLDIQYELDGKKASTALDGKSNTAIIRGVKGTGSLKIKISRNDLKGRILYKPFVYEGTVPEEKKEYIVFIGASIGKGWNLEELAGRQPSTQDVAILYLAEYRFDKKRLIDHVLTIPIKPKMVLLKECAAYFPLDEGIAVDTINEWFTPLVKSGIESYVVTTVPVTPEHDDKNKGRVNSILMYNNLLRNSDLQIFDIASVLGDNSEGGKYLLEKFASKDGLHLNQDAYNALDQKLIDFLVKQAD